MILESELARLLPKTSALSLISVEDAIIDAEPTLSKYEVFRGVFMVWTLGGGKVNFGG